MPRRSSNRSTEHPYVSAPGRARRSAGRSVFGPWLGRRPFRRRRGPARHALVVPEAVPSSGSRPARFGLLLALLVLITGSGALGAVQNSLTGGTVRPAALAVPRAGVKLPAGIEALSPYLEQDSCNPVAMAGAVKLGDLLRATYPGTSYGIARACGTRRHGERALRGAGRRLVHLGARRRRSGSGRDHAELAARRRRRGPAVRQRPPARRHVPHLEQQDLGLVPGGGGWRPYSNCAVHPERAYDTTCHRDHIHISLSWAGAMRRTSFWTGAVAAVDYGPCRPAEFNWAPPTPGPGRCRARPRRR